MKRVFFGLVGLFLVAMIGSASAQQTGFIVGGGAAAGNGLTLFNILTAPNATLLVGQGASSSPAAVAMSGDCSITASGAITCTKTNGSALGSAATANVGTSGSNLGLLNTINTFGADQIFGSHVRVGTGTPSLGATGGTGPSIVGDDTQGEVTMGTGSPTTATITFAVPYSTAPLCNVTWQANPLATQNYSVSASAITVTQTATSSNKIDYGCRARNGG